MSEITALTEKYAQLRQQKVTASAALNSLKQDIEKIPPSQRAELVKSIRAWEDSQNQPKPAIRPLGGQSASKPLSGAGAQAKCAHCETINPAGEMFCLKCGWPIQLSKKPSDKTVRLDPSNALPDTSYFGADYALLLLMKDTLQVIRKQSVELDHELIIGRAAAESIIAPDIDLTPFNAIQQGISRAHLALRYEANKAIITIADLDSANGSFVNEVRLHPNEVRVLRHGDELRIGKLTFEVIFQHS
ncbi:MAG: FHA domain-containing protein [Anaerolineae bacterium]|nr:FHA domain-containing protein [Anaerolineae bacterium]